MNRANATGSIDILPRSLLKKGEEMAQAYKRLCSNTNRATSGRTFPRRLEAQRQAGNRFGLFERSLETEGRPEYQALLCLFETESIVRLSVEIQLAIAEFRAPALAPSISDTSGDLPGQH
jgi:hypothetical protein